MARSKHLSGLSAEARADLEHRLHESQGGKCFLCGEEIDLAVHRGSLDIDHIEPLQGGGPDDERNFALTHDSCNRSKGASHLEVARALNTLEQLHDRAREEGRPGANLGDVLRNYRGSAAKLRLVRDANHLKFSLPEIDDNEIRVAQMHVDNLSGMGSVFISLPLEYLHHDDHINPRNIGSNIRGLLEEFRLKRPQLHVALAWWGDDGDGSGPVRVFDGQHKAAAQILLGVNRIPLRLFIEPDQEILLEANTRAGAQLRQVAFGKSVLAHLSNSLWADRVRQYREQRQLPDHDERFSELDVVNFFKGKRSEIQRHIRESQCDSIMSASDNLLNRYVERGGRKTERPLSYSTVNKTLFAKLLYPKPLETDIGERTEQGLAARELERQQMVGLMNAFAEAFFIDKWDFDIGGHQLVKRRKEGEQIADDHLRASRLAREEVMANVVDWVQEIAIRHFATAHRGKTPSDRLLHRSWPEPLWVSVRAFLVRLAALPCWVNLDLADSAFSRQKNSYWEAVFDTGRAPDGQQILAKGLDLNEMISDG